MKTRISSKGRIVLPAELRRQDGIAAGEEFVVERIERGVYRLARAARQQHGGVVDWLLSCPHKGFFAPLESGSTAAL